ncbi:MAG: potassium channel family protein [Solirubrobacterales bacterium]
MATQKSKQKAGPTRSEEVSRVTLPPEAFKFSRVKDNPLQAILQRIALASALVLLIALITYIGRDGYTDSQSDQPLTFIDALYYATVSVTTTGYGDIVPATQATRLINVFIVTPARILFIVLLVGTTLQVLAERSRFLYRLRNWQKKLDDHTVICGFGVKGQAALEYLRRYTPNMEAVAIDDRDDALNAATAEGLTGIRGSSYDPAILQAAEIERAKTVVVSLDSDDHAVLTILRVRERNGDATVVAACREQSNAELLKNSGADHVIVSSSSAGRLLGMAAEAPEAAEVVNDLLTFGAGLDIDEWQVTEAGADPEREEGDTVVAIIRGESLLRPDEPGCLPTEVGDRVVYVARRAPGTNGTNGTNSEGTS